MAAGATADGIVGQILTAESLEEQNRLWDAETRPSRTRRGLEVSPDKREPVP